MYAIINSGSKQYRVEQGQVLSVDRIAGVGSELELEPVLLVDGEEVFATPDQLRDVTVAATVIAEHRGQKINGFLYKDKSNNRKRWGHRSELSRIEITSISKG